MPKPERYDVSTVREYEANDGTKKTAWLRCGVAFPTKDGRGFTITLDALPTNGRLVMLPHEDREEREERGGKGGI